MTAILTSTISLHFDPETREEVSFMNNTVDPLRVIGFPSYISPVYLLKGRQTGSVRS